MLCCSSNGSFFTALKQQTSSRQIFITSKHQKVKSLEYQKVRMQDRQNALVS